MLHFYNRKYSSSFRYLSRPYIGCFFCKAVFFCRTRTPPFPNRRSLFGTLCHFLQTDILSLVSYTAWQAAFLFGVLRNSLTKLPLSFVSQLRFFAAPIVLCTVPPANFCAYTAWPTSPSISLTTPRDLRHETATYFHPRFFFGFGICKLSDSTIGKSHRLILYSYLASFYSIAATRCNNAGINGRIAEATVNFIAEIKFSP